MKINDKLVSIIVPVYNAEKFLNETIKTVQQQTYNNWELIFVNDCSPDNSIKIIKEYMKEDKRIKLFEQEQNGGAALARNRGVKESTGELLCFLDSDDIWDKYKIEKQVKYILENDAEFIYTSYEFANEKGIPIGKKVIVPTKINYKQALKNTTIWTSTVMFNLEKISKSDIEMPNVRRGQDTATWWKILKKIDYAYGMQEVLAYYRRTNDSLSSNKFTALKRTWNLYRNVENLNIFYSFYNFCWYCYNAIKRRI